MKDKLRALNEEAYKVWRDHILPMKKKRLKIGRPADQLTNGRTTLLKQRTDA